MIPKTMRVVEINFEFLSVLIKEIVHGYRDTIKSIDIDDNLSLTMTEDFFEGT